MRGTGRPGVALSEAEVREVCSSEFAAWNLRGKKVLAIVPDNTRTAPLDLMFRVMHEILSPVVKAFDVLIALGTHPPMSDAAINQRLGITEQDRRDRYSETRFFNHHWDNPAQLVSVGAISEDDVERISGGRMRECVNVTINRLVFDYDLLLIIGPTFPHEVVGFSGGNKYLFPGISGREITDMFHWLGALITSSAIIGTKHTPVRAVVDKAASMVPIERKCASMVIEGGKLVGLYVGTPEEAWSAASDLSGKVNIVYVERPFQSVLSCAPKMYDEFWVGAKCVYKLEPVIADGGELIVYAPHIDRLSTTHGAVIRQIGYHVRDYFVKQMDRFRGVPRGVLAHSTHVKGIGTYAEAAERPRIHVTLATRIGEAECRAVNLGYRDWGGVDMEEWSSGSAQGRLCVPKAGETLYRLKDDLPRRADAKQSGLDHSVAIEAEPADVNE